MKFMPTLQIIEAVQFAGDCGNYPDNVILSQDEINNMKVYNKLHDSWIKLKLGDWIRVDLENDVYPINKDYMDSNYTEYHEDKPPF